MLFCGLTVPDAVTDWVSVCCTTGVVTTSTADFARTTSVPATRPTITISAKAASAQRGNRLNARPSALLIPENPACSGSDCADMTYSSTARLGYRADGRWLAGLVVDESPLSP